MNAVPKPASIAMGSNQPPLVELLTEGHKELLGNFKRWMDSAKRTPLNIEDDETTASVGMIVVRLRTIKGLAEDAHSEEKRPYLENGRVVDAFFIAGIMNQCTEMMKTLEGRQTIYANAKIAAARHAARIAEEAARRDADALLAQARHAEDHGNVQEASELLGQAARAETTATVAAQTVVAKPQDLSRVRATGVTVSNRALWLGTIEKIEDIDLNELRSVVSREDIERYIKAFVKLGGRTLKGVKIEETGKVQNR